MFDLDGTLLSTLPTITHYVNKTLQNHNIPPISEEECKGFIGDGARKLIQRSLASRGDFSPELESVIYNEYLADYDKDPYYMTEPYEGIPELISALRHAGVICAVISNKQDSSTKAAIAHFFGDAFAEVRGGIDGVPLKPDPASALSILSSLGVRPDEVMYIGDTAVDMRTGKSMNAALTVGVLWGFRDRAELEAGGADIIVGTPSEILLHLNCQPK